MKIVPKKKSKKVPLEKQIISDKAFNRFREILESGEKLALRVASGSMRPLIQTGEVIFLEKTDLPRVFDIIVFRQKSKLICHFIKQMNTSPDSNGERVYITGGLADLNLEDMPVPQSEILGIVVSHSLSRVTRARILMRRLFSRNR